MIKCSSSKFLLFKKQIKGQIGFSVLVSHLKTHFGLHKTWFTPEIQKPLNVLKVISQPPLSLRAVWRGRDGTELAKQKAEDFKSQLLRQLFSVR